MSGRQPPRAGSPPRPGYGRPHQMDHRASTGSLPPALDPAHYGHPPPPQHHYHNPYATGPSSPNDSGEDLPYYDGPHHGPPPGHPYPGPPPGHMYALPPHPLMRGGLPGQPAPMHASLRGPSGEDFRRELGGGPREPPGPGGLGHRNTVSSGGPKPILRQPPAPPPPPGDYPPPQEFRRPQGQRNPDAPQPGVSTRDTSPDDYDYDGRQYMHGRPPRGGFPPPDSRFSYVDQAEARYRMEQAQQSRGRPGDQSPPYDDYEASHGGGPGRARSRSGPRSRSVGPGARSRSRPPEREPQSAGPLVKAPPPRDWYDDDYEQEDYDDEYLRYHNGSDEVSGGSGPSRGTGNTHSRSVTRTRQSHKVLPI